VGGNMKWITILLFFTSNVFANETLFVETAKKLTDAKDKKEKEKIIFDFYADLNKIVGEIEKKPAPDKDPTYLPTLESLVFFELLMDRHKRISIEENRSCKDYKFYVDGYQNPQAEDGVSIEKYSTAAKWFNHLVQALCKK
jgi:hypothetical protein